MNFYTTTPQLSNTKSPLVSTKSNLRYSSASSEKTAQIGLNIGLNKWGFHTSMSFSDFGDLRMGKTDIQEYLTPFYVTHRNGQDMLMPNHNPRVQKFVQSISCSTKDFIQALRITNLRFWTSLCDDF